MGKVSTIGLDIAKSVFQVHGVDDTGAVVIRKRVGRAKVLEFFSGLSPCLIGIEACPSAHHWSRELQALGHAVRLMPPSYVKAYLKRSKNDANDAAAICEAVTRPSMRFVPTKSEQQQSGLMLHRTGSFWCASERCCRTPSAVTWRNSASSRPRAQWHD
jgi:transposase